MKRLWFCLVLCLCACNEEAPRSVDFTLLQLNDVYELSPLNGKEGSEGGLARVATVLDELEAENPNTWCVLAGDMLSPSALGLAKIEGPDGKKVALAGKQMVAVMNKLGLDFMTFGNHEFDLKEEDLLQRLEESQFTWIASSVTRANGEMFPKTVGNHLFDVGSGEATVKVGIFSVMLNSNPKEYVRYQADYLAVAKAQVALLQKQGAEIIIALTHQAMADDKVLAEQVAGINLVLGGHEHERIEWRGDSQVPVFKADANARTAYVHRFSWDVNQRTLDVRSEIKHIDNEVGEQADVAEEVARWEKLVYDSFKKEGFDLTERITVTGEDLDGREASIRNKTTALTRVIAEGILASQAEAEGAVYNSGTIRIDDMIPQGQSLTNYDVLRILPFGGDVALVEMPGELLQRTLDQGVKNRGKGGFLQYVGISGEPGAWLIKGTPIEPAKTYKIAMLDYLLTGNEENLTFLKTVDKAWNLIDNSEGLKVLLPRERWADFRQSLIVQLKKEYGGIAD